MLIVFEGLDFSGKSTLISLLRDYLVLKTDKTVGVFAETYHTESGKKFLESVSQLLPPKGGSLARQCRAKTCYVM